VAEAVIAAAVVAMAEAAEAVAAAVVVAAVVGVVEDAAEVVVAAVVAVEIVAGIVVAATIAVTAGKLFVLRDPKADRILVPPFVFAPDCHRARFAPLSCIPPFSSLPTETNHPVTGLKHQTSNIACQRNCAVSSPLQVLVQHHYLQSAGNTRCPARRNSVNLMARDRIQRSK
jgi:hypothetical protein